MSSNQKKILIRSAWVVVLIFQGVLYYEAFPLLLARFTRNHLPGNEVVNVVGYDLIGIGAWLMLLFFLEECPLRDSKVMHSTSIGAFIVLAVCIILTNTNAWS